jgi:hypothetical protein
MDVDVVEWSRALDVVEWSRALDVVELSRALDVMLSEWCCSVSMV